MKRFDWKEFYRRFLESPEWLKKRSLVIRRAKGRCERCGHVFLSSDHAPHVHHLHYNGYTDNPKTPWPPGWDAHPKFLVALCGGPHGCHAWLHGKTDRDPLIWSQDSLAALRERLDRLMTPPTPAPPLVVEIIHLTAAGPSVLTEEDEELIAELEAMARPDF